MNEDEFLEKFNKIEEIKEKNIHVVIVSSASFEREKERIESFPVSAYIEKSINEHKFKEVLSFLAGRNQL